MNLKEAAARLGVHYQTAYRWVRSGDLTAVRVGARYEVSDAAIHQFIATRQSVLRQAMPVGGLPDLETGDDRDTFLQDLEAMAGEPLVSIPALTAFAARRGSETMADVCVVAITAADGRIERAALDHPHPERAAFIAAALSITGTDRPGPDGILAAVLDRGALIRIPHVPQDRLRAGLRPELRQYLAEYPILGLLAAPVTVGDDVIGMVAFVRDDPGRPYTAEDEDFAARVADRIGTLVVTSRDIVDAWALRQRVADRFQHWISTSPLGAPLDAAMVQQLVRELGPDALVGVYDPRGRLLGVSAATDAHGDHEPGSLTGRSIEELVDTVDAASERANFERLATGELDYHDFSVNRRAPDGSVLNFAVHRAAVRRLDASLACVISVGRHVHVTQRINELIGAG